MINKIILASKSKVRKNILSKNGVECDVVPSNVDEDSVKMALLRDNASSKTISKNLAELKANKISLKFKDQLVMGADSVIDLEGSIISKPNDRKEAFNILKSLNGKSHTLISSVCISRGGEMIWNFTDEATLTMKRFLTSELQDYLSKISDETLYAYNVYQIEGLGKNLFSKIQGDKDTIMGLPIKKIIEYLKKYN
jgi:septum formation protein